MPHYHLTTSPIEARGEAKINQQSDGFAAHRAKKNIDEDNLHCWCWGCGIKADVLWLEPHIQSKTTRQASLATSPFFLSFNNKHLSKMNSFVMVSFGFLSK
jgi:hypothetical protein